MASIADQVILHPLVTSSLKLGATTVGRDKIYRAIQYFSRFFACLQNHANDKDNAVRFNNLKSALGLSRKRKPLEHLQAALKVTKDTSDPILAVCAIGRQLAYAIYLFNDMLIWADKIKFITIEKIRLAQINKRAAQFWMAGISLNLISGIYKHRQIQSKLKKLTKAQKSYADPEKEDKKQQIRAVSTQAFSVRLQLLQDLCDILSPSSTLGYHQLNDGVIGLAGVVSSFLGLRSQIKKVLGN